jgi:protein-S-isoprenylcysteine O-methyltransferase Ste14
MHVSPNNAGVRSEKAHWGWWRLGDIGLCFLLTLFAMIRGQAALDAAQASDWLAMANHVITMVAMGIMAVLPVIRGRAIARGEGLAVKVVATVGGYAIIPLAMLPLTWRPDWLLTISSVGLTATSAWEIWALLTLRRSFSVFPEARKLVTHGPYGFVRHPLYASYLVGYLLVALPRLSLLAAVISLAGMAAQIIRAKREEAVLQSAFPEYTAYAGRVPAFVPRIGPEKIWSTGRRGLRQAG